MKFNREKRIRDVFVQDKVDFIVDQMVRSVTDINIDKKGRKSYRNICQQTGRSRGVIKDFRISRLVFRGLSDKGQIEGIRRAS